MRLRQQRRRRERELAGSRSRMSDALAIVLPAVDGHPNRIAFKGCLTLIDVASDRAPSGARGHRVILTRAAALAALPSLLGMAVDYKDGWDGHDARKKCGIITSAQIVGNEVLVEGFIFAKDYPELETAHEGHELGMSYELSEAHVANMRESVWTLTDAFFTGAAILRRDKAAYRQTWFRISARRPKLAARHNEQAHTFCGVDDNNYHNARGE